MSLISVAKVGEIAPGTGKTVVVGNKKVAIFNVDSAFFAIDDTGAHRGGPLGQGRLDDCIVTCPWHEWKFDLKTGTSLTNPLVRLACYAVQIDGDDVQVDC